MRGRRKLWLSGWIAALLTLQLAAIGLRREWWPFSPITMYSSAQGPLYTGLALLTIEHDGEEVVLSPAQSIGSQPYTFAYRVLRANIARPEAIGWAAARYAEQRRREGRELPAAFEVARLTWEVEPGGDRHSPWLRKQIVARHTY